MTGSPASPHPGAPAAGFRLTGRHVFLVALGFFLLVLAANTVLITLAVTTFGGIETPDAYRKGLAYNARILAAEKQAGLGWRDSVAFAPGTGRIVFRLEGAGGKPVAGLSVSARVSRPATGRFDRELPLIERAPGRYESEAVRLDPGSWIITAAAARPEAEGGESVYETRRRLWLAP